jgi:hypothetical protein
LFASSSTDKSPLWRWDAHFAILFPACHPFPGLFSKKAWMAKPSKGFKPECYKEFLEMIS